MSKSTLNWNQRFAIIDHYKPSDAQICSAFGVQQNELDVARQLRSAGQFAPASDVDVSSYATMFAAGASTVAPARKQTTTAVSKPIVLDGKPITATKKVKEPAKRGRKGDKIKNAFAAIPAAATPAEKFAEDHGVSLTVLRQSKRFDPTGSVGKVHVKKVAQADGNKVLCIWRDGE
jgi:hypothetical protein